MSEKLYIMAGNYQQARNYAEQHDIKQWVYLDRYEKMLGLQNIRVVYTGTSNPAYDARFMREIAARVKAEGEDDE